jgi:hypothetical protein
MALLKCIECGSPLRGARSTTDVGSEYGMNLIGVRELPVDFLLRGKRTDEGGRDLAPVWQTRSWVNYAASPL